MGEKPKPTPEEITGPGKKLEPEKGKRIRVVTDSRGDVHNIPEDENLPDALEKIRQADK